MLNIQSPKNLSPTGVAPAIVVPLMPLVGVAIAGIVFWPDLTRFPLRPNTPWVVLGWVWLLGGILFWAMTLRAFVPGFRRGQLVTRGTFAWCRNPLYATLAIFLLPALGLILETWTLLALGVVAGLIAKLRIPREEHELERVFGAEWAAYAAVTHQILPMPPGRGWRRRAMAVLWSLALGLFAYAGALRAIHLGWGATPEERQRELPGDEFVRGAQYRSTRAISIRATPEQVWPWVAQLGWGRGGLYSYEWLENLCGCRMKNANAIVPEWQDVKPGDAFRMDPRIPPLKIALVDPPHALVIRGAPTSDAARQALPSVAWQFVIEPAPQGESRLIVRWQSVLPPGFLMELFNKTLLEPIHFIMEERMLRGIRDRASGAR